MQITWYGTASVKLSSLGGTLWFDPFVPLAHSKTHVSRDQFDGCTHIFVTHGHIDHIGSLPRIVRRNPNVSVYCTETPYRTLRRRGVGVRNLVRIEHGQTLSINGFDVSVLRGKHAVIRPVTLPWIWYMLKSPARMNILPFLYQMKVCKENDEIVFFQIKSEGKTISLMGSLNLREGEEYPTGSDILVLPYNGWDDNYPPAMDCIRKLCPKCVLLDHYDDTLPPFTMPLDLSPILHTDCCTVRALEFGVSVDV